MKWIRSFIIAFSMYSKIPMPRVEWTTSSMQYAFCFFPLVGAVNGALTWGAGHVLFALRDAGKLPALFPAVFLTILPLLVTGGIHMDGFLDTSDARHSYGEREQKLAILKDPHTGAFAVISAAIYLLWSLALWSAADEKVLPGMACAMVLSRTLPFRDGRKRSKIRRTCGCVPRIRQTKGSMDFHGNLSCSRCDFSGGSIRCDPGSASAFYSGSSVCPVSQDGSAGVRRHYRGSGRLVSPGL